jgi:hypothetical protein
MEFSWLRQLSVAYCNGAQIMCRLSAGVEAEQFESARLPLPLADCRCIATPRASVGQRDSDPAQSKESAPRCIDQNQH